MSLIFCPASDSRALSEIDIPRAAAVEAGYPDSVAWLSALAENGLSVRASDDSCANGSTATAADLPSGCVKCIVPPQGLVMPSIDPNIVADLKTRHPDVDLYALDTSAGAIVFRPPSRVAWKRFQALSGKPEAVEALACDCVVFPDRAGFQAMLERAPGIVVPITTKLVEYAGALEKAEAEKL